MTMVELCGFRRMYKPSIAMLAKSGSWEFVSQAGVLFLVGELVAETIRSRQGYVDWCLVAQAPQASAPRHQLKRVGTRPSVCEGSLTWQGSAEVRGKSRANGGEAIDGADDTREERRALHSSHSPKKNRAA